MKMSKLEFVEKMSELELSEDQAVSELTETLQVYERKYKLRSEIFYRLIVGTPAEDKDALRAMQRLEGNYEEG